MSDVIFVLTDKLPISCSTLKDAVGDTFLALYRQLQGSLPSLIQPGWIFTVPDLAMNQVLCTFDIWPFVADSRLVHSA